MATRRNALPYEQASRASPRARTEEYRRAVELAAPEPGDVVLDLPSGGGYLRPYLPPRTTYLPAETIFEYAQEEKLLICDWLRLPLRNGSVDAVISLAALHHLVDGRISFYREMRRVLVPGGRLAIADVAEGSPPARWLDDFVAHASSEGHVARFFRCEETALLAAAGFQPVFCERVEYPWFFVSRQEMVGFCRGLFRLDRVADAEIAAAVEHYLGVSETATGEIEMAWSLLHIRAIRP